MKPPSFLINLPIYGDHTDVFYFPVGETREGKISLLTNELNPLKHTGSYVPVPYLPKHDYVLLPGTEEGRVRITYSEVIPHCLQNFDYLTELCTPQIAATKEEKVSEIIRYLYFDYMYLDQLSD